MSIVQVNSVRTIANGNPDVQSIGQGQTWQNLAASRVGGTTYTNNTGRPIVVSILPSGDGIRTLQVNGVTLGYSDGAGLDTSFMAVVPNGATYLYTAGAGFTIWAELR